LNPPSHSSPLQTLHALIPYRKHWCLMAEVTHMNGAAQLGKIIPSPVHPMVGAKAFILVPLCCGTWLCNGTSCQSAQFLSSCIQ
jgi:hypothetical protein